MYQQGYITKDEHDKAEFPKFKERKEATNTWGRSEGLPHGPGAQGAREVEEQPPRRAPLESEDELATRGLKITTTIDQKLQKTAVEVEKTLHEDGTYGKANKNVRMSLVSMDPQTGAVKALYGGPDYVKQSLNTATQDVVQAGSTFKPFALMAGLENGVTLEDRFDGNSGKVFPPAANNGEDWKVPPNFGGANYGGSIDLTTATAHSVNTAYVQLNDEVGPREDPRGRRACGDPQGRELPADGRAVERPRRRLRAADRPRPGLLDHRGGRLPHDPPAHRGEGRDARRHRALRGGAAGAGEGVRRGRHHGGHLRDDQGRRGPDRLGPGRAGAGPPPVAGKTGTSNDNKSAWFAGFVPQLTTVVGLRQYTTLDLEAGKIAGQDEIDGFGEWQEITGGSWPVRAWTDFMQVATEGMESEDFPEYVPAQRRSPRRRRVRDGGGDGHRPGRHRLGHRQGTRELEKLQLKVSTRAQNSDQPKGGTVLEMSGANTEVPVGTTVTLVVSTGQPDQPEQVVVPNVVGQPRTTAEQMIYGDALQPAVREEFSDQPVGTVIDTDPPGQGTSVDQAPP